ncbi:hypothetical protein RGU70_10095 [Herbaspirillum sp. RTI4]|uniref:hypothetical protein n=1 Tax=Herbaspirillum sp. RTI4 TaxID=3048640 RepID=UPI002AB33CB0|nr:hypothetical protein [Herbaspirillum sp. RTI4]MDY7578673.1 hypothetical protein [Herbaspirillum sp. RTI4]MEA9980629.1 hypothetical protein [Herbaspirillum sp. RTI4]
MRTQQMNADKKMCRAFSIFYIGSVFAFMYGLANSAYAMSSISDGDLIVTLRDGIPCYSYPIDSHTAKRSYFMGVLYVSWNDRETSLPPFDTWRLESGNADYSPSSPESCLKYGVVAPGTSEKLPAKPHRYDVPYRAHLTVFSPTEDRKYMTYYCLSHNFSGETIIHKAKYVDKTSKYICVPN